MPKTAISEARRCGFRNRCFKILEEEGLCLLGSFSLLLVQFLAILHIADYDAAKFAQAGTGGDENITYSSFASVHL